MISLVQFQLTRRFVADLSDVSEDLSGPGFEYIRVGFNRGFMVQIKENGKFAFLSDDGVLDIESVSLQFVEESVYTLWQSRLEGAAE